MSRPWRGKEQPLPNPIWGFVLVTAIFVGCPAVVALGLSALPTVTVRVN